MEHVRWESRTRWYEVRLERDLLQDWVLTQTWGGRSNRRGGLLRRVVTSWEEGRALQEKVHERRARRGYAVVALQ